METVENVTPIPTLFQISSKNIDEVLEKYDINMNDVIDENMTDSYENQFEYSVKHLIKKFGNVDIKVLREKFYIQVKKFFCIELRSALNNKHIEENFEKDIEKITLKENLIKFAKDIWNEIFLKGIYEAVNQVSIIMYSTQGETV